MAVCIDENGRIDGSRTTVYHVMDYYVDHDLPEYIIKWLPLTLEQVHAAFRFIEENRHEVDQQYQKMLERCERGDPPEIRARIAEGRNRWLEKHPEAMKHWLEKHKADCVGAENSR